jgi:hypothetical protein
VIFAFETDMLLLPERPHNRHLLLGSAAAVPEILIRPMNSTSFQPTPMPSRNRPLHSTSRHDACFAINAVWRCAMHGVRVAVAESTHWGGTCVNVGCIPKKLMVMATDYGMAADDARGFGG